jgi:hypothetical protein
MMIYRTRTPIRIAKHKEQPVERHATTKKGMTLFGSDNALLYVTGMAVDGDGSPHCYHPNNIGLDYNANAFDKSRNLWVGVVCDAKGNPIVQGPGQPAPGYYVSPTSLRDPRISDPGDARRYVNSETIPYIAFPGYLLKMGGSGDISRLELGVNLGDYCIVYHIRNGKLCPAIFADVGPRYKLGEGSIRVAQQLGLRSSPKNGGTEMNEIAYVIFPRTFDPWPRSVEAIEEKALALFAEWGGLDRLKQEVGVIEPAFSGRSLEDPPHAIDMPEPGERHLQDEQGDLPRT